VCTTSGSGSCTSCARTAIGHMTGLARVLRLTLTRQNVVLDEKRCGTGNHQKNGGPSFSKRGRRDARGGDLPHAPLLAADPPHHGRGQPDRQVVWISPDSGPDLPATSRSWPPCSPRRTSSGNGTTARSGTAGGSAAIRSPMRVSPGTCAGSTIRPWSASSSPSGTCKSAIISTSASAPDGVRQIRTIPDTWAKADSRRTIPDTWTKADSRG